MDFFTVEGLATIGGAIAATKIITTVLCNHVAPEDPRAVAGVVAIVIQVFVWMATNDLGAGFEWISLVESILSAAVVYLGATGTNAITVGMAERKAEAEAEAGGRALAEPKLRPRGSRKWW